MQALKKAERARQSGLQEEDLPGNGLNSGSNNGLDDGVDDRTDHGTDNGIDYGLASRDGDAQPGAEAAHGHLPRDTRPADASATPAGRTPASSGGGLELSLEPLDAAPPRTEPSFAEPLLAEPLLAEPSPAEPARAADRPRPPPPPAIEPALEATHNPVPPQARHEGSRARADAGEIPVADARAAARPAAAAADTRRGPGAPERRAVPRTTPAQADAASGIDLPRLRVAGLAGVLMIVAGTFGYLYWQAVSGPGPGASLPMVPMPPPSATGATGAAGTGTDGGIVVAPPGAPSGPPFGPLGPSGQGADTGAPGQSAPAPVTAMAPPLDDVAPSPDPAMPVAEPAPLARPAPRAARAPAGPSAAQLVAIEDPDIRREALRDAMERADRSRQMERTAAAAEAPAVPFAIDTGPPAAPAAAATPSAAPDGGRADVHVARGSSTPAISPAVQAGYAAFAAGDLAAASRQYGTALRNDPNNRDALLGSAAIAARERRDDEAARLYLRLLAIDPRDADAIAGLTALRPGDGDRAEVRLKGVLRDNPNAAPVHFALGNLYARQRRWQEAQQAYFHAWSAAPGNADYAFNLAVGLDRLNQGRLAREYYQRALALAADGAAAFDRAAVQRRLLELAPAAGAPAPTRVPVDAPAPATFQAPAPATLQAPAPAPATAGN
ncbi:tetratricopeptide repeat protein [Pseudoduganella umbonata]|uniref:Tetratricopeptide (TPR) repeat protein n=1 Tax=Pseudoduganella umbonata TaxID=864828 RepID=A0A4V1ED36_9BURK|nr:tetratricopeptide repeat protein [Pseudoduganella umbonata]MBB3219650.1 tetratricopeptide (TPR) repeat protein [Pseudoduganella umbonata]QCP09711.1 tetratricopeptide repeat protein [Pseudoduganella umbonata]